MGIEMYMNVLDQLKQLDYTGIVEISGFSEPFLHDNLNFFVFQTKHVLPNCTMAINTNGDLLSTQWVEKLFQSGLDKLSISIYSNENHLRYVQHVAEESGYENQIYIRKRYGSETIWNNRAGALETEKQLPLQQVCYYPFYTLYINWNGDIQFCSNDPRGQVVLGNVEHDKIVDVWYSEKLNEIRRELMNNRRNHILCNQCDVPGNIMGEKIF